MEKRNYVSLEKHQAVVEDLKSQIQGIRKEISQINRSLEGITPYVDNGVFQVDEVIKDSKSSSIDFNIEFNEPPKVMTIFSSMELMTSGQCSIKPIS